MSKYLLMVFLLFAIAGCTSQPVHNIERYDIPAAVGGQGFTELEVRNAIIRGCRKRGWTPREAKPGLIVANITLRSHQAAVEIPYDSKTFSILYNDSANLDYRKGNIHRNYNKWVLNLFGDIRRELGVTAQSY